MLQGNFGGGKGEMPGVTVSNQGRKRSKMEYEKDFDSYPEVDFTAQVPGASWVPPSEAIRFRLEC